MTNGHGGRKPVSVPLNTFLVSLIHQKNRSDQKYYRYQYCLQQPCRQQLHKFFTIITPISPRQLRSQLARRTGDKNNFYCYRFSNSQCFEHIGVLQFL